MGVDSLTFLSPDVALEFGKTTYYPDGKEPMSGLDPRARVMLKDRLMEARTAGRTIFFSSHILADIEEICDRIGILHAGKIIYLGKSDEFMSTMNAASLERAFLAALEAEEKKLAA